MGIYLTFHDQVQVHCRPEKFSFILTATVQVSGPLGSLQVFIANFLLQSSWIFKLTKFSLHDQ